MSPVCLHAHGTRHYKNQAKFNIRRIPPPNSFLLAEIHHGKYKYLETVLELASSCSIKLAFYRTELFPFRFSTHNNTRGLPFCPSWQQQVLQLVRKSTMMTPYCTNQSSCSSIMYSLELVAGFSIKGSRSSRIGTTKIPSQFQKYSGLGNFFYGSKNVRVYDQVSLISC